MIIAEGLEMWLSHILSPSAILFVSVYKKGRFT